MEDEPLEDGPDPTAGLTKRTERMRMGDLVLLKRNARYMKPETFQRLVANIKRDGCLTSAPFAARMADGRYEVLSGNHRVMAAIEALGPDHVDVVLVTDDDLSRARRLAIQLSHNSIEGEDDPDLLRDLWGEIDEVEFKDYAGLDDEQLGTVDRITVDSLSPPAMDFQSVTLLLLPHEKVRATELVLELAGQADETWLARAADTDRLFDQLAEVARAHGVRNTATALMLLLDLAERHVWDLAETWDGIERAAWVPVSSVVGTMNLPVDVARVVRSAIDRMVENGDVSAAAPWQALELWAADYLAGVTDAIGEGGTPAS